MLRVRMLDFLKTGVFAGMALGTDHLTVKGILGKPEAVTDRPEINIWKYGSLEIILARNRILEVSIHYSPDPAGGAGGIVFEGWAPQRKTTIEEMEAVAKREGLPFRQSPQTFFDDWLPYEFDSGVAAIFLKEGRDNWLDKLVLETAPGRFSRP